MQALEDNIKNFYLERYMILILAIGSIIMFLILVWAGFTNTLRQQNSFIKAMNKIPIEVKILIYILFGVFALHGWSFYSTIIYRGTIH